MNEREFEKELARFPQRATPPPPAPYFDDSGADTHSAPSPSSDRLVVEVNVLGVGKTTVTADPARQIGRVMHQIELQLNISCAARKLVSSGRVLPLTDAAALHLTPHCKISCVPVGSAAAGSAPSQLTFWHAVEIFCQLHCSNDKAKAVVAALRASHVARLSCVAPHRAKILAAALAGSQAATLRNGSPSSSS